MENVIINIVTNKKTGKVENYSSVNDIKNLINYVCNNKDKKTKVQYWSTVGLVRDLEASARIIDTMQKYLNKAKGRRMYHVIISFPSGYTDTNEVYLKAHAVAEYLGNDYQLIYGIHTDTDNLHIHIAMNSVSYKTYKKWHTKKSEFEKWKKKLIKVMDEAV